MPQRGPDVVAVITCYLVLILALPSRLTVGPLGGAGTPAALLGIAIGAWWVADRASRPFADPPRPSGVRRAYLIALACVAVSYVVAMTRAIDFNEVSNADLGLVALLSWGGVLLAADDGIDSQERLDTLLRRMVVGGSAVAVLGMVQFVTGQSWIDQISIPGLVANQTFGGVNSRGSFNRPGGTALHAIEFGSLLTLLLPLAIGQAMTLTRLTTVRRWLPVGLLAFAVLLSISRSAMICAVVGLLVAAVAWPARARWGVGLGALGLGGFVFMAIPGMLGTLVGMFTGIGNDTSALSRVDSYAIAGDFIARSPLFGRGLSTFLPSYRILDNEYLLLLIEVGVVGTAAFLWLFLSGFRAARRARRTTNDPDLAVRCQALLGSVAAGAIGFAFYDGFGFPMASGMFFLVLGLAGAQARLAVRAADLERAAEPAAVS